MYKLANGFTKETVMEKIRKYNRGTAAVGRTGCSDQVSCMYVTPSGNRCFIGCFIPDEWIERAAGINGGVHDLLGHIPALAEYLPFSEYPALIEFQNVHDELEEPPSGNCDIRDLAQTWLDENVA